MPFSQFLLLKIVLKCRMGLRPIRCGEAIDNDVDMRLFKRFDSYLIVDHGL